MKSGNEIVFSKAIVELNGLMKPELLPVVETKPLAEGKQPRKESTTSTRVFDLEKKEWRSFTTKNVTRVEFSIP